MKPNAWNPVRRNRNIGTKKSGRSQNNSLVIPERWRDCRIFWERLNSPVAGPLQIKTHSLTVLVEPTKSDYVHACTPQDIHDVLQLIQPEHLSEIDLIGLTQTKKKQERLNPAWGRLVYYAELGKYSEPAIYLEAVKRGAMIKWGKKLSLDQQKEHEVLDGDGHRIIQHCCRYLASKNRAISSVND